MLIIAGTLLGLVLVPLLGGRLAGLAALKVRRGWLLPAALGLQIVSISIFPTWPRPLLVGLHALSYVLAGLFVWTNRRVPGLVLLASGGGMNALAIAVNGGQMPASPTAIRTAGLPMDTEHFVNSGVVADPRLAFLGDVFASPAWLPMRNVYSLGDIVILLGALWVVQRACGTVLARDPRPALRRLLAVPVAEAARDGERYAEACRERDEALAEVARVGERNVELVRQLTRLRQERPTPVTKPAPVAGPPAVGRGATAPEAPSGEPQVPRQRQRSRGKRRAGRSAA